MIKPVLSPDQYAIERAICDKAAAYADSIMRPNGNYVRNWISADEAKHPDYAACDNDMRGRVDQYEILTNLPDSMVAYIGDNNAACTWTGLALSHDGICTSSWRVNSYVGSRMYQHKFQIGDREYTGKGFGKGMSIVLRETAASKRKRAAKIAA